MSNKHTPGPWAVYDWEHVTLIGELEGCGYQVIDSNGNFVSSSCDESGFGGVEEANIRLIAAAPDLLEALKEAIETIKAMSCKDLSCDPPEDVSTLEAAIEKATGANNG